MCHKAETIVQRNILHYCLDSVHNTSCFRSTFRRSVEPSHQRQMFADSSFNLTEYLYGGRLTQNNSIRRPAGRLPISRQYPGSEYLII